MSTTGSEFIEVFLEEASHHLQYLREYCNILQDPYPVPEELERLYVAAHTLLGSSAMYGYPLFSDVSSKLAHIFQYAMNASISTEASGPLVEFISEAVAVLESDLLMISTNHAEAQEEIDAFRQKYPFAFQGATAVKTSDREEEKGAGVPDRPHPEIAEASVDDLIAPDLPPDGEVAGEVMEFFVPEAEEHLQTVTDCLLALEANPRSQDIHRLFRAMHTIKGSAAQVGLQRISRVAHRAEDLIGRLRDGALEPSPEIVDLCLEAVDTLKKFLYRQWSDEGTLQTSVKSLLARIARLAPEEEVTEEPQKPAADSAGLQEIHAAELHIDEPDAEPEGIKKAEAEAEGELLAEGPPSPTSSAALVPVLPATDDEDSTRGFQKSPAAPASKSVRIALERLDRMMNAVGELVINRTRMLGRLAELERLADVLNFSKARLIDKITEFQEKYEFNRIPHGHSSRLAVGPPMFPPAGEQGSVASPAGWDLAENYPFRGGYSSYSRSFDPALAEFSDLEMDRYDEFNILSRSLTEISADITEVLSQLDGFVRRVDGDIDEFTKLAHRLQDEITQARMVPIGNLYTRIARTARDAAKAANKLIELQLEGAETELDNNIIQQIADPLLHLVRNAVAHGIERPDERYGTGKPDHGNVAVRAYHRGNHIYIEVEDDGRGINYGKVRSTAVELGLVTYERASQLSERELLELLFHPGFSTAPRKSELAGRGVGLDVVRSNLTALNGEIDIDTQQGLGTRFTLKVPLTLIISQALFVRCGNMQFAFPLSFVEEIRRLRSQDIEEVGGKLLTKVRDEVTEVVRLDKALGLDPIEPVNGFFRMVIVSAGGRQVGIVVEEVLRKDEIVIKSLGEYLRNVKLFPGVTIAPEGSLILLIDLNRLIAGESIDRKPLMLSAAATRVFAPGAIAVAAGEIPPEVMTPVPDEKIIVLADDSISVRKFVGRMLEKAGYRVKLAADGLEALELVAQGRCDLVITDLEMPRTNGYELMMHLRQNPVTRTIPVMVVTSRAGAKHRERAIGEGATAFLVKPVQEDQLISSVAQLLGASLTSPREAPEQVPANS